MKKKTLQEIEDYYKDKGYRGDRLRKILLKNKEWLRLYKKRQIKLTKSFPLTKTEQNKYVMSINEDYRILRKVKQLERLRLTKHDKFIVEFIKTQLEFDWREYLIKTLDKILKKYSKKKS